MIYSKLLKIPVAAAILTKGPIK